MLVIYGVNMLSLKCLLMAAAVGVKSMCRRCLLDEVKHVDERISGGNRVLVVPKLGTLLIAVRPWFQLRFGRF